MYFYYDESGKIQPLNEDDELQPINFNPEENNVEENMNIDEEPAIEYE